MGARVEDYMWIDRPQEAVLDHWLKQRESLFWPLQGDGGTGKSSLLIRLLDRCNTRKVPVVWTEPNADLEQFGKEARALDLIWLLQTANTPTFSKLKVEMEERDLAAVLDLPQAQAVLAEAMAHVPEGLQGWAGLLRELLNIGGRILNRRSERRRRKLLARPEELLLAALLHDMRRGGVWLIDTWEKISPDLLLSSSVRLRQDRRLETLARTASLSVDRWLMGLAGCFSRHPVLWVVAGRNSPVNFGGLRSVPISLTNTRIGRFTLDEIATYLTQALPELPEPPDAVVAAIERQSAGNPGEVAHIAQTVREELYADPAWAWERWLAATESMPTDEVSAFVMERLSDLRLRGDRRFWRLAVPDVLREDMASVLFPLEEGAELPGEEMFRIFVELGILKPRAGTPDVLVLHDEDRRRFEAYARKDGIWDSTEARALHARLAAYFDRRSGWPDKYAHHLLPEMLESRRAPRKENADPNLLLASFHTIMANSDFEKRALGTGREEFYEMLAGSISIPPSGTRSIADKLDELSALQIFLLVRTFEEEREHFGNINAIGRQFIAAALMGMRSVEVLEGEGIHWQDVWEQNSGNWAIAELLFTLSDLALEDKRRIMEEVLKVGGRGLKVCAAFAFEKLHDPERAEALFLKAIEEGPDKAGALSRYAEFLCAVGRGDEVESWLDRSLEIRPDEPIALRLSFRRARQSPEKREKAVQRLRAAIEKDSGDVEHYLNLGRLLWEGPATRDEGEQLLKTALSMDGTSPEALYHLGCRLAQKPEGQEEAAQMFQRLCALQPDDPDYKQLLADVLTKLPGRQEEADALYRQAQAQNGNDGNLWGNHARLLIAMGREDEAESKIATAFSMAEGLRPLQLECWFYRYACFPLRYGTALAEMSRLLHDGIRSPGFDLSAVASRGRELGHSEADFLTALAAVIAAKLDDEESGLSCLDAFPVWRAVGRQTAPP